MFYKVASVSFGPKVVCGFVLVVVFLLVCFLMGIGIQEIRFCLGIGMQLLMQLILHNVLKNAIFWYKFKGIKMFF